VLRARKTHRGYTLAEMMAVLGLMALLTTLAFPLWQGYIRDRRVAQASEQIAGVLRFAQQAAVANSVDACLYRALVSSALARAEVRRVARDGATGMCSSPEVVATVRVTDAFPRGVTAADATIEFTSAGRLNGGVAVSISVSAGDRVRYVRVDPDTGRVEVSVVP
jgi:prepilin-type N-terminal cleavage/methylation domain-containing protein